VSDGGGVAAGVDGWRRSRPIGIAISVALVFVAIFLATRPGDEGGETQNVDAAPRLVDAADLTALEGTLGHEVYWAGERAATQLELSEKADGNLFLRYLPDGVEAGDPRVGFLTVGTYPVAGAVEALRRTAAKGGARLRSAAGGAVVLVNPSSEGSVYLAYPGSDLQIEVYDPAPGRALGLIRSGAIRPVS
jgi:hypothetical protein